MDEASTPMLAQNADPHRTRRMVSLVVGVLVALLSGTAYAFGAFETDLKERLELSQSQLNSLGVAMDAGLYLFKPIAGTFHDTQGPSRTCLLAMMFGGFGYGTISLLCTRSGHTTLTFLLCIVAFMSVGLGSGLAYISALSPNAGNVLPARRGAVVGTLASGFGLSATVVSLIYSGALKVVSVSDKLPVFFGTLAGVMVTVFFLGSCFIRRLPVPKAARVSVRPSSRVVPIEANNRDDEEEENPKSELEAQQMLVDAPSAPAADWREAPTSFWQTVVRLVTNLAFVEMYFLFAVGAGCGLFVINNIGSMQESLSGKSDHATKQHLVITLAVCNCFGRLLCGFLSDRLPTPRSTFLTIALLCLSIVLFVSSTFSADQLFITVVGTGLTYGAIWAVVPTILTELFGMANFGKVYGVIATAPAISGFAFNHMAGEIYDRHTHSGGDDDDGDVCYGKDCFRTSLLVSGAFSLAAGLLSVVIFARRHRPRRS